MAGNPKLIVLFEKFRGVTFELNKPQMSIGRRDGNDICIKDGSLSGHHADILCVEKNGKNVYVLRDNNSTNGTRINNVPLTGEQELKNSDLILFGGVEVLFDSNEINDSASYTKTHTIDITNLNANLSSTPSLNNLSPLDDAKEEQQHAKTQSLVVILLVLAAALVVGLLGYVCYAMFTMGKNPQKSSLQPAIEEIYHA